MRFIGGSDGMVFVGETDAEGRIIASTAAPLGCFDWGRKPATPECIELSKALLKALLNDDGRVRVLYMRFMYRTVAQWKAGDTWTRTSDELMTVIKAIEANDADIARARMAAPVERMVIPSEPNVSSWGKSGYGGNDTAPDRRRR